ncbi:MAG: hypothetical protein AABY64_14715 [Bdellovibrionota bacterium]
MKLSFFLSLYLCTFCFGEVAVGAANHYVLAGASGSANGSDWTNAFKTLPANLIRGDTYYIGVGSYPAYTFDDAHSGTLVITIKKATLGDHGTEVGWQTSYAAQAVFNSILRFLNGYYLFDGQVRNESNWFDGPSYGFRVDHNNQDQNINIFNQAAPTPNITIKHVYINSQVGNLPNITIARYSVSTDTQGGPINTGLVFSRMFVNGSNNVWFLRTTDGAILEYSASQNADGNSANHGEIVNLYYSSNNAIIRYNIFRDEYVPNGSTAMIAITAGTQSVKIYGNVFSNFRSGDGAIGYIGSTTANSMVYNNTIDSCNSSTGGSGGIQLANSPTNLIYNNIWTNCGSISFSGAHDYNAFPDSNAHGESNAQLNVPTSIFMDYAGRDFRLKSQTTAGITLLSPFNIDLLGFTRGASGAWSRGAFQFINGTFVKPMAPIGLKIQ